MSFYINFSHFLIFSHITSYCDANHSAIAVAVSAPTQKAGYNPKRHKEHDPPIESARVHQFILMKLQKYGNLYILMSLVITHKLYIKSFGMAANVWGPLMLGLFTVVL